MTDYDAFYEGRDGALYQVKMLPVVDDGRVGTLPSATVVGIVTLGEYSENEHARGDRVADIPPRFRRVGA